MTPERLRQIVATGAVNVSRDIPFMVVPGRHGSRRLEHENGAAWRRRLVLDTTWHDKRVALPKLDHAFAALRIAQCEVKVTVENEEELVGVVVDVPDLVSPRVGDLDGVIVHACHDSRAVEVVEGCERLAQVDRFRVDRPILCAPQFLGKRTSNPRSAARLEITTVESVRGGIRLRSYK